MVLVPDVREPSSQAWRLSRVTVPRFQCGPRLVARFAAVVLLAFTTTVLQPSPAAACSCIPQPEAQYATFIGTAIHRASVPSASGELDVRFNVDEVLMGTVAPQQGAKASVGTGSCGFSLNIEVGSQYLVKGRVDRPGQPITVNTCGGQLALLVRSPVQSEAEDRAAWSRWAAVAGAAVGASAVLVLARRPLLDRYRKTR